MHQRADRGRNERHGRAGAQRAEQDHGEKQARQDPGFGERAHFRSRSSRSGLKSDSVARQAVYQFSLEFVGGSHLQIGVVDDQPAVGRQSNRALDESQAFLEQRIVTMRAMPALAITGVGDVELRARVARGRIGARKGGPRLDELVPAKEGEAVGKRLPIDGVGAEVVRQPADGFGDGARLGCEEPRDENRIANRGRQSDTAYERLPHRGILARMAHLHKSNHAADGRAAPDYGAGNG